MNSVKTASGAHQALSFEKDKDLIVEHLQRVKFLSATMGDHTHHFLNQAMSFIHLIMMMNDHSLGSLTTVPHALPSL